MRHGTERMGSLLAALAMVCSLVVVPASAAGGGESGAPRTVTVDAAHQRFIYANHPLNTEEGLTQLAGTLEGACGDGSKVEVAAKWVWDDSGSWAFRPGGCAGDRYGFYSFKATSLTVPGENSATVSPSSATLEVMVIAVNARQTFETASGIVSRSRIGRFTGENWKESLGLPDRVNVTYAPAGITDHPEWNEAAGDFSEEDCTYRISGWELSGSYVRLTPAALQDAVDEGKREIKLTPIYAGADEGGRPAWATLEAVPRFTLIIADDRPVDVTVTPPGSITYGQELGDPCAEQEDIGGGVDESGRFIYRYVGVEGTDYDSGEKPTDAGTYQVTAVLDSLTHSGEGTSAPFTIRKAAIAAAAVDITVPEAGGARTVYVGDMGLSGGAAKGGTLKAAASAADGTVLAGVTGAAGGASFTLDIKPAEDGKSQGFPLALTSDNYETLIVTVNVTAAAKADGFAITHVAVKSPGTFEYGTPLKEIIDLDQCAAIVNGVDAPGTFELITPDRRYGVGEDTAIQLQFRSGGRAYRAEVPAGFTIKPAVVTPDPEDSFLENGYFVTVYANSPHNASPGALKKLLADRTGTYSALYGQGKLELEASWRIDAGGAQFDPKGQRSTEWGSVWYTFTAALAPRDADADNFAIDIQPKAYVRVVPVNAAPALDSSAKSVEAAEVMALTEENWKAGLGLPETAGVTYTPAEKAEFVDERDKFTETSGTYDIIGWKMDGIVLTLPALKAKAAGAGDGEMRVTLTPICDGVPAWAAVAGTPAFELTITPDERSG